VILQNEAELLASEAPYARVFRDPPDPSLRDPEEAGHE
jgi:hypothetical protein